MTRSARFLLFLMLVSLLTGSCLAEETSPEIIDLGVPTAESYSDKELNSRNPWAMAIHEGILYIGAGDYSANTGPVDLWGYDLEKGEWSKTGLILDEAVMRFVTLNGELLFPGIDPKTDWSTGYYYTLTDGKWKSTRVSNAIHMYDIVDFDNARFVGIGTSTDLIHPVLVRREGEKNFSNVEFYRDGKEVFGSGKHSRCRTYDIFLLNGEMYATVEAQPGLRGVFKYQDGAFHYLDNPAFLFQKGSRQTRIYEKVVLGDTAYFTNGRLYKTTDFIEVTQLELPGGASCEYLYLDVSETGEETLYVLGCENLENNQFRNSIWKYVDDATFEEVYSFEYGMKPMSFLMYEEDFYVGMGRCPATAKGKEWIGQILKIDR